MILPYRTSATIGHLTAHRDWGTIAKCPWCPETDIKRRSPNMITCGKMPCQYKQNQSVKNKKPVIS